jgi:hypothetical protein
LSGHGALLKWCVFLGLSTYERRTFFLVNCVPWQFASGEQKKTGSRGMLGCPLSGLTQHPEHGASGVLLLRLLPLTCHRLGTIVRGNAAFCVEGIYMQQGLIQQCCLFGDKAQAGGHSHTAFFVLCRRRRRTQPPAGPAFPPSTAPSWLPSASRHRRRCSCVWVRLRPVCLVVPGTDLRWVGRAKKNRALQKQGEGPRW